MLPGIRAASSSGAAKKMHLRVGGGGNGNGYRGSPAPPGSGGASSSSAIAASYSEFQARLRRQAAAAAEDSERRPEVQSPTSNGGAPRPPLQVTRLDLKTQQHKACNIPGQRAGTALLMFRHYARIGCYEHDAKTLSAEARPSKMVCAAFCLFVCALAKCACALPTPPHRRTVD
jgi:hypothetical protein